MSIAPYFICQSCGYMSRNTILECVICGHTNNLENSNNINSNQIKMNPELMPLIRKKIKTATTRKGIKKIQLGNCEIVNNQNITDAINGFIHKIEIIKFKDISLELAEIENYNDPEELKNKLIEIYGPITDEQFMTIIYFNIN